MNNTKNRLKVLIVEDDLITAANLAENLEDLGYDVVAVAKNSTIGFEQFLSLNPDIAILDINLEKSELDGIELAHKFNENKRIPIIYLTSYDDEDIRKRAKPTKPAAFLIKPPNIKQVDLSIEFALNRFYETDNTPRIANLVCPFGESRDFIFVKLKDRYERIDISEICYLRAAGSSCEIFAFGKKYVVSNNLGNTLAQINNSDLIRVHHSFAVNFSMVKAYDDTRLFMGCSDSIKDVPVSRKFRNDIFPLLPKIMAG